MNQTAWRKTVAMNLSNSHERDRELAWQATFRDQRKEKVIVIDKEKVEREHSMARICVPRHLMDEAEDIFVKNQVRIAWRDDARGIFVIFEEQYDKAHSVLDPIWLKLEKQVDAHTDFEYRYGEKK